MDLIAATETNIATITDAAKSADKNPSVICVENLPEPTGEFFLFAEAADDDRALLLSILQETTTDRYSLDQPH